MSDYIRSIQHGGTFFFTLVTYKRQKILTTDYSRQALREAITTTREKHPFEILAWVLLPDHLHCIWRLPPNDTDYSKRWGLIKAAYSKATRSTIIAVANNNITRLPESKKRHREAGIWQRRFWEHQIMSEHDYQTHLDYIHYNPVKHGLVQQVCDWPYSSFHRYCKLGVYPRHWCSVIDDDSGSFGE